MFPRRKLAEISHDLAAVIDPVGNGLTGPRDVDGGEAAAHIQEEAMCPCPSRIEIESSLDLAAVVDPAGAGAARSPRDVDGGEAAAHIQEEAMCPSRVDEKSHDLAAVIDPGGVGRRGPRDVDGG